MGAVSVLLGTTIFWGAPDVAHAATAEAGNGTQKINSEETNKQQNNLNQKKVTLGSQPKTESSQSKTDSQPSDPARTKQAANSQKQAQQQATLPSEPKTEGSQAKTDSKPSDPAQAKQATDNKKSVKVAKTTANDNSEDRTVTYQFIGPDGTVVDSYTATGKVGSTVKINQDEFNRSLDSGYYFADPNYQVPTSYTYTDAENPIIKINVKKVYNYTIKFQDDTDPTDTSLPEVTWNTGSLDSPTHQQAAILANLNQWIQQQGNMVKYHGYYQNNPNDPNLSKYPVSADWVTPLPSLTALPDHDITKTIEFKHHTYDVTCQIPLWQAPNVQLTQEGMDTLLKAFNGAHQEGGDYISNIQNELDTFTASAYFHSLLPQIFKGAKWTSGGLIVSDLNNSSPDDPYSGGQDWNLFNTAGSGSNLLSPLYGRPMRYLSLKQNGDKFYLTNADYQKLADELGLDSNSNQVSAIVGQLPMLTYQAEFDGFNPDPDPDNNGQSSYMIGSNLTIKPTNINDEIAGKNISDGYDIQVLIPVLNQSNNTVKYQLVSVQSHDLQNAATIDEIIDRLYGIKASSLNDVILNMRIYPVLQPNSDGTYSWTLSNIGSGYGEGPGSFGALAHDYSDPDYAVKFLNGAYSPIYNEAIKEAMKESGTTEYDSTFDGYTPLTMFYVLTSETESATITYIDDATHKTLKTETTTGPFDSEITFANDPTDVIQSYVQQGYTLVSNDFNNQKFQVSGNSFTVHLTSVSGNSDSNYVSDQSESRHVTRTINVTNPDGTTTTITQVATITRTGKYYSDSGQTVWGDWSTDSNSWAAYQVPAIEGYTPTQATVASQVVDSNTKDTVVEISYLANKQTIKVVYKDGKRVIKTDTLTGRPGQTVAVHLQAPKGYHIVGQPLTEYTFKAKNNPDIFIELAKNAASYKPAQNAMKLIPASNQALSGAKKHAAANNKQAAELPQTGNTTARTVLALLCTGLAAIVVLAGKRKEN